MKTKTVPYKGLATLFLLTTLLFGFAYLAFPRETVKTVDVTTTPEYQTLLGKYNAKLTEFSELEKSYAELEKKYNDLYEATADWREEQRWKEVATQYFMDRPYLIKYGDYELDEQIVLQTYNYEVTYADNKHKVEVTFEATVQYDKADDSEGPEYVKYEIAYLAYTDGEIISFNVTAV